jgi:hypothetical protein
MADLQSAIPSTRPYVISNTSANELERLAFLNHKSPDSALLVQRWDKSGAGENALERAINRRVCPTFAHVALGWPGWAGHETPAL